MSDEYGTIEDPTRLCPTCRMPISVLATRCRHCGEVVGRPRREETRLTVKDLGGETRTQYVVSGNVMDALEAFRAEELTTQEEQRVERLRKQSWFGRRDAAATASPDSDDGLPSLDEDHQQLSSGGGRPPKSRAASTVQEEGAALPRITRTVFTIAAVMAALVLFYLGSGYTWARFTDYLDGRRAPSEEVDYTSRAVAMLNEGRPIQDAYDEALRAIRTTDKEENHQALAFVREELATRVNTVLNAPTFDRRAIDRVSASVNSIASLDMHPEVQQLAARLNAERAAHDMVLVRVNAAAGEATFRINNPHHRGEPLQTVGVGQRLQDRFLVQGIAARNVQLLDTQTDRRIQAPLNEMLRGTARSGIRPT